jgi:hypothetical protein
MFGQTFTRKEIRLVIKALNEYNRINNHTRDKLGLTFQNGMKLTSVRNHFRLIARRKSIARLNQDIESLGLTSLETAHDATSLAGTSFLIPTKERCAYLELSIKFQQMLKKRKAA